MTSLLDRLRLRAPGIVRHGVNDVEEERLVMDSLPAVLNLIEAARATADQIADTHEDDVTLWPVTQELRAAVAVFVSGQEEPT